MNSDCLLEELLLAEKYDGDIKYMRTHKRLITTPPPIGNDITIYSILKQIKQKADETIEHNEGVLDNQAYFIQLLQPYIINACKDNNTSVKPDQVRFIDNLISQEYFEERIWAA